MTSESRMQSFFFWILWLIGLSGNLTIVYGFLTHELDSINPIAIWFIALFFTLSPFIVLYDGRQSVCSK